MNSEHDSRAMLDRLKFVVYESGLSLTELAKRTGIAESTLGNYLSKTPAMPSMDKLARMCKALGVSADSILGLREEDVLAQAVIAYGAQAQICMMFEEMSELQKELCKRLRGRENVDCIAEEIADVEIMLDQMKLIFSVSAAVADWRGKKLERLQERLKAHEDRLA